MANVDSKITLKLLVDDRSNKVLFAEAGKDFIDFMFSFLTLPLGSVIKLLSPLTMMGSIGKLYQSVENLNETYLVANRDKSSLLQPKVTTFDVASPLLLGNEAIGEPKYYLCNYCSRKITATRNIKCPNCNRVMSTEIDFVVPSASAVANLGVGGVGVECPRRPPSFNSNYYMHAPGSLYYSSGDGEGVFSRDGSFGYFSLKMGCKIFQHSTAPLLPRLDAASASSSDGAGNGEKNVGGFVKGVITYMITDDLEVTPLSAISSITLINRFSMKKDVQLEEKVVAVGMKEGLALLKASLDSLTPLTDVFYSSSKKAKASSYSA